MIKINFNDQTIIVRDDVRFNATAATDTVYDKVLIPVRRDLGFIYNATRGSLTKEVLK